MVPEIDYELAQSRAFIDTARHLVFMGHASAARIFESLSELCFDKTELFREIETIVSTQLQTGAKIWEECHQACAAGCHGNDLQYEVERYDLYSEFAFSFEQMSLHNESTLFERLADACYEKATLFVQIRNLARFNADLRKEYLP